MKRSGLIAIILLMLVVFLMGACTAVTPTPEPLPTVTAKPIEITTTATLAPVTIKIGMFPYSSYLPFVIADEEGYFAEQGITVEFENFTKIPDAITALSQGFVDVSAGGVDVSSLNSIAQGSGIMFVADKGYLAEEGCTFAAFVVADDVMDSGELEDISKIEGMKVAMTKATVNEYILDMLLAPFNLSTADVEAVELPANTRLEAIIGEAVDIAQLGEPWVTRSVSSGEASVWKPFQTIVPGFQFSVVYFGPTITQENPDVGKRFMVAYLKAVQQYNEGKTDRNVELMIQLTQSTEEEIRESCWQTIRSDGSVNLQSIVNFQQWGLDGGYLLTELREEDYWDPQYIDYANAYLNK